MIRRFDRSDLKMINSSVLKNGIRREAIEQWEKEKYSFTLCDQNRIIAICGVITIHQGVGEIWLILEDNKSGNTFKIARSLKRLTDSIFRQSYFHRFQSRASADNKVENRFLRFLGFEKEGILKQFGLNREDYFVYGRVKKWQR